MACLIRIKENPYQVKDIFLKDEENYLIENYLQIKSKEDSTEITITENKYPTIILFKEGKFSENYYHKKISLNEITKTVIVKFDDKIFEISNSTQETINSILKYLLSIEEEFF